MGLVLVDFRFTVSVDTFLRFGVASFLNGLLLELRRPGDN